MRIYIYIRPEDIPRYRDCTTDADRMCYLTVTQFYWDNRVLLDTIELPAPAITTPEPVTTAVDLLDRQIQDLRAKSEAEATRLTGIKFNLLSLDYSPEAA